jgi:hypothetical protein
MRLKALLVLLMLNPALVRAASLGMYADRAGTTPEIHAVVGEPFTFFAVVKGNTPGMIAVELRLELPDDLLTTAVKVRGNWCNCDACPDHRNILTSLCTCVMDPLFSLVEITALYLHSPREPTRACAGPMSPSFFDPPAMGYATCANDIETFDVVGDAPHDSWSCSPIVVAPVPSTLQSFGALKTRF